MAIETQYRPISPRLGTYYAIFTSALVALVVLLLILEQLGARKLWLSHVMMASPIAFYLGVALANRTLDIHIFASAGRRIPAVFGGLSLAATAIGGISFFALTGALYLIGFDALYIALGLIAGLFTASVLFMPFIRKSGSYTLPSFFHQRFASAPLGAIAAFCMAPPLVLLVAAELQLGAFATTLFASISYEAAIAAGATIVVVAAAAGGLRSLIWTQSTLYIVMIAGFLTPIVILALLFTNLPFPQFSYGELFERIATFERATGFSPVEPGGAVAIPGHGYEPMAKPFLQAFGAIGRFDFVLLSLCVLAGTAAMPSLVMRASCATSAFETRHTCAWGSLFLGLFLISAPAYAAIAKFLTLRDIAGTPASRLPEWLGRLADAGLVDFTDKNGDGVIGAAELLVARDGVALSLPIMGDLPFIIVVFVAVAGIAATLAAAAAHTLALGQAVGEDLYRGIVHSAATPSRRQLAMRLGCIAVALLGAWVAAAFELDALRAAAWAMSLTSAAFFPALVLSIWWTGATGFGVAAGMVAGFALAAAHIGLAEAFTGGSLLGVSSMAAGVPAMIVGASVAVVVSQMDISATPGQSAYLAELRDPSGAALFDRAVLAAAKRKAA